MVYTWTEIGEIYVNPFGKLALVANDLSYRLHLRPLWWNRAARHLLSVLQTLEHSLTLQAVRYNKGSQFNRYATVTMKLLIVLLWQYFSDEIIIWSDRVSVLLLLILFSCHIKQFCNNYKYSRQSCNTNNRDVVIKICLAKN